MFSSLPGDALELSWILHNHLHSRATLVPSRNTSNSMLGSIIGEDIEAQSNYQATQIGATTCVCDSIAGHPSRDPGSVSQADTGTPDAERQKLLLVVASWNSGSFFKASPIQVFHSRRQGRMLHVRVEETIKETGSHKTTAGPRARGIRVKPCFPSVSRDIIERVRGNKSCPAM